MCVCVKEHDTRVNVSYNFSLIVEETFFFFFWEKKRFFFSGKRNPFFIRDKETLSLIIIFNL